MPYIPEILMRLGVEEAKAETKAEAKAYAYEAKAS